MQTSPQNLQKLVSHSQLAIRKLAAHEIFLHYSIGHI